MPVFFILFVIKIIALFLQSYLMFKILIGRLLFTNNYCQNPFPLGRFSFHFTWNYWANLFKGCLQFSTKLLQQPFWCWFYVTIQLNILIIVLECLYFMFISFLAFVRGTLHFITSLTVFLLATLSANNKQSDIYRQIYVFGLWN